MKRVVLSMALLLLPAGRGVRPTVPVSAGEPAVGVGAGPFLHVVAGGHVQPVLRQTGRLGDVPEALALLGAGPGSGETAAGLHSELPAAAFSVAGPREGVLSVQLYPAQPLGSGGIPEVAVDQVVRTAIAVSGQGGADARGLRVRPGRPGAPAEEAPRACPVIA